MSRAMQATTFERSGAVLECFLVPWDSEIFGFPVAQIGRIDLGDGAVGDELLEEFDEWCANRDVRLVACRLDHLQLRESMTLEGHGFRFVETVYGPRLDKLDGVSEPRQAIVVSKALPSDLPSIQEIAYSAFTTGRFLLDWRLPPELSKRRYASWVRTSFYAPRQTILKAEADGDLVGFFIAEQRPDGSVYWHLTAVAPKWQGQGMGLSLWQTMLLRHRDEGASYVETTISGHNVPAINLYSRLGFSFGSSQMTFHWLREPASAAPS
jgi:ribosomal protein S18 acetylase RimI-like enzyme